MSNWRHRAWEWSDHTPAQDLADYVKQQIIYCLSQSLRIAENKIEKDIPFSDYGMDSILGANFVNQVGNACGIKLNTTIIFDYPTVNRLASHVAVSCKNHIKIPLAVDNRTEEIQKSAVVTSDKYTSIPKLIQQNTGTAEHQVGRRSSSDIAVIGMSGQFPGAGNPDRFWENLIDGQDAVGELPPQYLDRQEYYSPERQKGKTYCHKGGVLDDRDCFDPLFFNLSPRDAESMNPHQRLILQESWRGLEDAGYNPRSLAETRTGVFVGSEPTGYFHETFTGASEAIVASRLSYFLNLRGPAFVVNTGCSSSGVALHLACESLRNGESTLALAGGVFASMSHESLIPLSEIEMLSPSGRCSSFDASGDGMVLSEGVGMVVLKRLEDAEKDGDAIYGVIKGSGLNQDGASNGITAPNGVAQEELIADVYRRYSINPEDISYVEAHGTGTRLGDPVEANALTRAFRKFTDKKHFCALGSAKAHIGHTAASAAVVGLIKVLLSLKHRKLPGLLHFQTLNPQIEFEDSPFYIRSESTDWHGEDQKPLTAALNSFGHSGTNVHLVISEYQPSSTRQSEVSHDKGAVIVPVSAKDEERLKEAVRNLHDHLDGKPASNLKNLAYTLQIGRDAMSRRVAFTVSSIQELKKQLKGFLDGENTPVSTHSNSSLSTPMGDAGAMVAGWMAARAFEKVAAFWSQGGDLDWQVFYGDQRPSRINLPTYPFAKERYWANTTERNVEKALQPSGILLAHPGWMEATVPADAPVLGHHVERLVLIFGVGSISGPGIKSRLPDATVVRLNTEARSQEQRYEEISLQVLERIQTQLRDKPKTRILAQLCIGSGEEATLLRGISGLLQTAQQENPKLMGQIIEVSSDETDQGLLQKIEENSRCPQDGLIRYLDGTRQVIAWREILSDTSETVLPWHDGGVYLITGGTGGLGLIFAEEIANKVHDATLVLTSRSPLNQEKQECIKALERLGAVVEYRQVDVSRQSEVRDLIQHIQNRYGSLHGILHSAGIHRDNYLIHKTQEEFRAVLGPKVAGVVYLDQCSLDMPLDFVVLFSSGAGVTGNLGQADYAAANAFMDQFAGYRQRLVEAGKRQGRTLSINWPLWQEGGMRVDKGTEAMMREKSGMVAMLTSAGIEAFYKAWGAGQSQIGVVAGDLAKIRQHLLSGTSIAKDHNRATSSSSIDTNELRSKTLHQLKELLGAQIKLSPDRIASHEPFERYGIDSIVITELNRGLEAIFGEITKTLFFEYQTLSALTDYFIEEYPQECAKWSDLAQPLPIASNLISAGGWPDVENLALTSSASAHQAQDVSSSPHPTSQIREPIAIIGISGRYPQADSLDAFWKNLETGKNCITEIPPDRWSLDDFYHEHPEEAVAQGKSYGKWGSFLEGFADFDPLFFNISGREAMSMDPQERLFLQSAWEVLEDAGYTREVLKTQFDNNVGVFAGITKTGYDLYGSEWRKQGKLFYPHTSFGSVANRVSYLLNLRGPSMPIDTMCSSSLTAIHEACERLRQGVCHMAIAGGVNLYLHPTNYVELSALKMLSKDGKCRSFGKGGDGFVPGEGVGVVLLKPLSMAIEDKDRIYAVIRATGVNHGGKTNGYTVPNPKAQAELIRETLNKAGVNARTVSYVEAHGTGTELGDPIEVRGLTQAFQKDTSEVGFCALGSIKSNMGHLEAAAGIAGLTKILVQMHHKQLAPSLHAAELNPNISFEKTPFYVQQKLETWNRPEISLNGETREYPRIASVSSFGAGGANAHVVIEEYCEDQAPEVDESQKPVVIVLSARNEDRLRAYAASLLEHVQNFLSNAQLRDFAYTLQIGREAMDERLGVLVRSREKLIEKLHCFLESTEPVDDLFRGRVNHEKETLAVQDAVESTNSDADLARLLDLWVQGNTIDWNKLYGDIPPRRIGAPTYPFARERYWIAPSGQIGEERCEASLAAPSVSKGVMSLQLDHENTAGFLSPSEKPSGVVLQALTQAQVPSRPDVEEPATLSVSPVSMQDDALEVAKTEPVEPEKQEQSNISKRMLMQELKESLAKALYLDQSAIDVDRPFIEMGLDSIVGVEWVHALNNQFSLSLAATKVYDYPTIGELAEFLQKELVGSVSAQSAPFVASPAAETALPSSFVEPREAEQTLHQSQPKAQHDATDAKQSDVIAIVGMSGRYPEADDLNQFWDNLTHAKNSIREIPKDRWDVDQYFDQDPSKPGKIYCKWLGALEDVDCFDPLFFMISPAEAESMDPQHRLFLQEGYKAFEDAGYGPQSLSNKKCGVYMGIMSYEYAVLLQKQHAELSNTGNSFAIGAARIPYFLNLKGPAIPVDTACSSSLVAIHLACQALKQKEVDMALAGGVSLYLVPESYLGMCAAGMVSPDGQCKTFDDDADGFVPGEGVGGLVLKRLEDAERDDDHIFGLIIGSGINQDGKTNGITAPSVNSQIELERDIYNRYGINPASISFVETHGTGTKLGDPIELEALSTVFKEWTDRKQFCGLGSVKTNIGHTSAAAGVASVHKVLLCMRHQQLAPTLNFTKPNRHFNFEDSPFYVNTELKPWDTDVGTPRRAAVSAFGFSGTNAHLVLEEYVGHKVVTTTAPTGTPVPIILSAMREEGLVQIARNLHDFLVSNAPTLQTDLQALAYTLQIGRAEMEERLAFTVTSVKELIEKLQGFVEGGQNEFDILRGRVKRNDETLEVFADDETFKEMIVKWVQQRKWSKILEIWIKGLTVDWNGLYENQQPRRISLPTYPFARQRCWLDTRASTTGESIIPVSNINDSQRTEAIRSSLVTNLTFPLHELAPDMLRKTGKKWLSFAEDWVSVHLEIEPEAWTEKIEATKNYSILVISQDVQDVDGLRDVCRTIATLSERQYGVWDLKHMPIDVETKSRIEAADLQPYLTDSDIPQAIFFFPPQSRGTGLAQLELVYSCVQSVIQTAPSRQIQLYCCYQEQPSDLGLYGEALAGLFKSAMLESVHHRYRAVSYDAQLVSTDQVALRLIQEWLCDETLALLPARVPMIRYAQGNRFELRVNEVGHGETKDKGVGFRSGATYLMVGALGAAGQLICEELGRRYQAQLVIFSRRDKNEVKEPLGRIQAAGASVIYRTVDILDQTALQRAMKSIKDNGIEIHGVIHMARRVSDVPIIKKSFPEFREVISAKVEGTLNIDVATAEEPLEFFLMFSSMAAFGIQGSPDYAFSAAFQNAMARYRNRLVDQGRRSGRTRSICWGQWEVDGAIHPDKLPGRLDRLRGMGMDFIDVPSAMILMELSTNSPFNVVAYMAVKDAAKAREMLGAESPSFPLAERVLKAAKAFENKQWSELEFASFLDTVPDGGLPESLQNEIIRVIAASDRHDNGSRIAFEDIGFAEPLRVGSEPERHPEVSTKEALTASVMQALKISQSDLDWDQSLQTYGLDSIVAMQLAAILEKSLKFSVEPKWLIEHPTLNELASKLEDVKAEQLSCGPAIDATKAQGLGPLEDAP